MKNLFDFATKELSQDAFICWLVSNYDNEENIELQKLAYDFINFISNRKFNIGDIIHLNTLQQANNMDVIIDIWDKTNNTKDYKHTSTSNYVIVIEDKTDSSAHTDQLKNYGDIVRKWNKNNYSLVFYKSNILSNKDKEELEKDKEWKAYTIKEIYGFFKDKHLNDEIVIFYIEHICRIYKDLTEISNELIGNWNFYNFRTFLEKEVKQHYKYYNMSIWLGEYMGMYVSYLFEIDDPYSDNKIVLEFFFRKYSDKINATIHPHIIHSDCEAWHAFEKYKEEDEKYFSYLKDKIRKSKSGYFKPHNSKQCVGTSIPENDISKDMDSEEFLKQLDCRIQEFIYIFK